MKVRKVFAVEIMRTAYQVLYQRDMYVNPDVGRHRSLAGVSRHQVQRSGREKYGAIYSSELPTDLPHTCPCFRIAEQSLWQAQSESASSIIAWKSWRKDEETNPAFYSTNWWNLLVQKKG